MDGRQSLCEIYRESYRSAHVLLNGEKKEIKCEACRVFYLFFAANLIKFNNTRARM